MTPEMCISAPIEFRWSGFITLLGYSSVSEALRVARVGEMFGTLANISKNPDRLLGGEVLLMKLKHRGDTSGARTGGVKIPPGIHRLEVGPFFRGEARAVWIQTYGLETIRDPKQRMELLGS